MNGLAVCTAPMDTPWGPLWLAWADDLCADTSPYGDGPTPEDAIADLQRQLEDDE